MPIILASVIPDELLVVGVSADSKLVFFETTRDPRIIRAEHPEALEDTATRVESSSGSQGGSDDAGTGGGKLRGAVLEAPDVEFAISVPDDPRITEVRIYRPQWDGGRTLLDLWDSLPMRDQVSND